MCCSCCAVRLGHPHGCCGGLGSRCWSGAHKLCSACGSLQAPSADLCMGGCDEVCPPLGSSAGVLFPSLWGKPCSGPQVLLLQPLTWCLRVTPTQAPLFVPPPAVLCQAPFKSFTVQPAGPGVAPRFLQVLSHPQQGLHVCLRGGAPRYAPASGLGAVLPVREGETGTNYLWVVPAPSLPSPAAPRGSWLVQSSSPALAALRFRPLILLVSPFQSSCWGPRTRLSSPGFSFSEALVCRQ